MLTYLKMKKAEWKIKAAFYETVLTLIEHQKEASDLLKKLYAALKDVPADRLQQELITKFAEIIHAENGR